MTRRPLRKPGAKNRAPERVQQVAIVRWLRLVLPRGSVVYAIKNEHAARSASIQGRMMFYQMRKAEGVVAGFPDIGVCLPAGETFFIETKAPKVGVLSDDQQRIHGDLIALGHRVGVATDIESARWLLQQFRIPLAEAPGQLARPAVFRSEARSDALNDAIPF